MNNYDYGKKVNPGLCVRGFNYFLDCVERCARLEKHYKKLLANQVDATRKARKARAFGLQYAPKRLEKSAEEYRLEAKKVKKELDMARKIQKTERQASFKEPN
jgi:hypothetical protein